jgi:tetratricopeptide (TPR) repeat protein
VSFSRLSGRNGSARLILPGCHFLLVLVMASPAFSQARPQRPALIRDTEVAEGKDDPDVEKEKVYNPMMAEKILKIGDFYYKRKNYSAAIQRYIEALQYQPNRIDAYEALGRTYEKTGEISKAVSLYKDFVSKNPDSPKATDFREKIAKLEKKS